MTLAPRVQSGFGRRSLALKLSVFSAHLFLAFAPSAAGRGGEGEEKGSFLQRRIVDPLVNVFVTHKNFERVIKLVETHGVQAQAPDDGLAEEDVDEEAKNG